MSNKTFHALAIALAGSLCAVTLALAETKLPALRHVAGPPAAEDLLTIPGTRWVLVSAVSVGAETAPGIYAVSNDPPHLEKLAISSRNTKIGTSACASPLDLAGFSPLGISWRQGGKGDRQLLVINRGSRKAVEIFSVTNVEAVPVLHWHGCVPLPAEVNANSVASLPDGGILVTQNSDPRDKDSWAKSNAAKSRVDFIDGTPLPAGKQCRVPTSPDPTVSRHRRTVVLR